MLLLTNLLVAILSVITIVLIYFKRAYSFWDKHNVQSLETSLPFGNFKSFLLQKISIGEQIFQIYNQVKNSGKPYYGIYMLWQPSLIILDPNLAKDILLKDFPSFYSRQREGNSNDPLSFHLVNISGKEWKFLRMKLTPTFSSGKMRSMYPTIVKCGNELISIIIKYTQNGEPLEIKDIMARFSTDIIASCAFGVECNSLKEPDNEFRRQGSRIFNTTKWEFVKVTALRFFPFLSKVLHLKRLTTETVDFFQNLVATTVEYRERNNFKRKDFLDLLMQLKSQGFIEGDEGNRDTNIDNTKLTMNQMAAQSFVFFIAGFETLSSTLSSAMYELARNEEVQDKARVEIRRTLKKYDNQITYDAVMEMEYLDQVLEETMRLHPSVQFITRKCTADYQFPNSDLKIKKGMVVFIPHNAYQRDPKYFPDPEVFNPDRFTAEEKAKRHSYVYLPFGAGPRQCIGMRFAKLEMKFGLATLLKNHKFTLNSKTPTPMQVNPRENFYSVMGGIWINSEEFKD